jgi:hypothetical protein
MSEITPAQKTALLKLPGFKEIRDQYAKEQKMAGAGKRRMKGGGFWDSVYNWFVDAGTTVNDFLKKTKLISNVAGAVLPILAPMGTALLTANPLAAAASVGGAKAIAEGIKSLGYGSKSMHMMPDGSMMKGKMHGGMMMRGAGNQPLAINPPDQRMRGVAPKSKMRGAGLLQDIANDPALRALGKRFVAPLVAPAITSALSTAKKLSGIAPKSTMRGAGKMRGKGFFEDVLYATAPLASLSISNAQNTLSNVKKMRGKGQYTTADIDGTPTLSMLQNRKMRSIAGSGYGTDFNTMGVNGVPQVSVAPSNSGMIHNIGGKGMMKVRRPRNMGMGGTEYGMVTSEFGNVKF